MSTFGNCGVIKCAKNKDARESYGLTTPLEHSSGVPEAWIKREIFLYGLN